MLTSQISSVLGAMQLQITYGFHPKEVHSPSSKICIGIVQIVEEYIWFLLFYQALDYGIIIYLIHNAKK